MTPTLTGRELDVFPGVAHAFTTRQGGVSTEPFASLNLGRKTRDDAAAVQENWRRACATVGSDLSALACLNQVHGAQVVEVEHPPVWPEDVADADAAFTCQTDVVLSVAVADCVPVVVVGDGVIGVAHSGWRGTVAGVVSALVSAMAAKTGLPAGRLRAVVGPRISAGNYEVGSKVAGALVDAGLQVAVTGHPLCRADLGVAVEAQLHNMGVERVEVLDACTWSDPRFFSHRRDGGQTGRQAALVVRRS